VDQIGFSVKFVRETGQDVALACLVGCCQFEYTQVEMDGQTDRQTDRQQTVAICLPLEVASVKDVWVPKMTIPPHSIVSFQLIYHTRLAFS